MIKKSHLLFLVPAITILQACQQVPDPAQDKPVTSLSKDIEEIRPGILQGYLSMEEMPNSLQLLPPPPEENSAEFALDQALAAQSLLLNDSARTAQAQIDNNLHFPEAIQSFNRVLNVEISESNLPLLYLMLRRTLADAGLSTYAAKDHYNRTRPFVYNETPICVPEERDFLINDGSYPSGHTSIGWAWALILSELFPDQANEILERGKEFGLSRMICNVHWNSDIVAGRMIGAATVAKLHANPDFMTDLNAVKEEIAVSVQIK